MDTKVVVILLGVLIFVSVVKSQNLGPDNCLINRIDVIPCKRSSPRRTRLPGPNEFGVYSTKFRPGPAGFPKCNIISKNHEIRNITVIGGEEKIKAIYSPGFTLEPQEKYGNQMFVNYSIKCKEGEVAYMDVGHLDLEEANCLDPTLNEERCVDYVQVDMGIYGITESCGKDYSDIDNLIIQGDAKIIFRSNSQGRFPGFLIWVTCFKSTQDDCNLVPNSTEILKIGLLNILKSDVLQDDVIPVVLANENACNPIVRAYVNAIIERYSGTEKYRMAAEKYRMAAEMAKACHQGRYQCNYQGEQALIAGDNEVGDYTTRIDSGGYCWIRIQDQSVRTIPILSGLMHIYSPGYYGRRYDSNKFVEYNIKCEDGEIAYMEIEDFMLNAATCSSTGSRCIDYVQVSGEFGILFDACGAGPPSSSYIIPADTFQVIFRSYTSFPGYFHITILCLSGKPQNYKARSLPVQTRCRDGLDNEAYHQDFMQRIKRQVGTRKIGDKLTSRRINVLYGMNVTYYNNTIDFIDSKNNQIIPNMSIFNIETLYTYHINGDVIDYNVSALENDSIPLRFSGPGPMFITTNRVYFQLFITNTSGFVPNDTEREILKILKSDVFLDNVVLVAKANEQACNPIVRAYAKSVLEIVVKSQNLGPDNCLISRMDVIPCNHSSPKKTKLPGPNQFGVYFTRFLRGSVECECKITFKNHEIRNIRIIGDKNKVRIIYSPGFTLEPQEKYGNQMLVNYSIKCEDGEIAYLNITNLDLEEKNCMDPNLGEERCVDYVQVYRGGFGVTESCGTDASENTNQLELGNITIIFRTSSKNRYPGFAANIICFNRNISNQEGCTRPLREGNDTVANEDPTMQQSGQRRKRDLEMFHEQWKRRAAYIERMKRQVGEGVFILKFKTINVTHGENVTYSNNKLEFIDNRNNKTIPERSIDNIISLHTFDANGDIDFFRGEAKGDSGALIRFPGPGPMFIVGGHAYFQLFVIDPRGLVPNAEEMAVLDKLTEAQLDVAREDESERLTDEILNPDEPDFNNIGLRRRKRQANIMIRSFDDEVVKVAIANEMACNPVLRTSANAILQYVEQTEPGRVNMLRAMLTTAPPTTLTQTSPTSTEASPTSTETSPTSTEVSPISTETSLTSTEVSPTSTDTSPIGTQ